MPYVSPSAANMRNAENVRTKWYIACQEKTSLWTGRVNGSFSRGERTITYENGAMNPQLAIDGWTWVWNDIVEEMPVYVTTSYGVYRCRIKSLTGDGVTGTFTFAENSVPWTDHDALEVTHDFPFFPKFPYIDSAGVIIKDRTDNFGDQTTYPPPVAVQGPDFATWMYSPSAELDARDSYVMDPSASITSWAWTVMPQDGTTIDDGTAEQTTIHFTYPGHYWVKLEVTDSNTKTTYNRALYHVFDDTHLPIPIDEVSITSSYDSSGSRATFRISDTNADEDTLPDEARILIFADDYYDDSETYEGGYQYKQGSKWQGYVIGNTVTRIPGSSQVEFQAESITNLMERVIMLSMVMEYNAHPTAWEHYGASGITVAQALHFLFLWHSNLFHIAAVILPIDNTIRAKYIEDFENGTLLSMAKTFSYEHSIFANICCNDLGIVHCEVDAQIDPTGYTAGFDLTDADWIGDLVIEHNPENQNAYVEISGFAFSGGAATPYYSRSSEAPADRGSDNYVVERLMCASQAQLNEECGRVWAKINNPYPRVSMNLSAGLAISHSFLLMPQHWYEITIDVADTVRGFDWSAGKYLVPREINTTYKANGTVEKSVVFEPKNEAPDGIDGVYPTEPDIPDSPEVPPPYYPPIPPEPTETSKYAVTGDSATGPWWTTDACTTWENRATGLPDLATYPLFQVMVKRGWQVIQGTSDPEQCILVACGLGWIYVSYDAGKTWINRTPLLVGDDPEAADTSGWIEDGDAILPLSEAIMYSQVECPNIANNTFYVLARWPNVSNQWRSWYLITDDMGLTYSWTPIDPSKSVGPGAWSPGDSVYAWDCTAGTVASHSSFAVTSSTNVRVDGGGYANFHALNYGGDNDGSQWYVIFDMGGNITVNAGTSVTVHMTGYGTQSTINNNNFFNSFIAMAWSSDGITWHFFSNAMSLGLTYTHTTGTLTGPATIRYFKFYDGGVPQSPTETWDGYIDAFWITAPSDYDPITYSGGQTLGLGLSIDFETGNRLGLTYWVPDEIVASVTCFDLSFPLTKTHSSVWPATQAQVEAVTRWLFPRVVYQPTVTDYGKLLYLFGTDASGNGYVAESTGDLSGGFIEITDRSGGLTASLAGQRVRSLLAQGDGAGQLLYFYAMGNGKIYKENGSWTWDAGNAIPFTPTQQGASVGYDTNRTLLIANPAASATKVEWAAEPYTSYTDKTDSHGVTGSTYSIVWVTP